MALPTGLTTGVGASDQPSTPESTIVLPNNAADPEESSDPALVARGIMDSLTGGAGGAGGAAGGAGGAAAPAGGAGGAGGGLDGLAGMLPQLMQMIQPLMGLLGPLMGGM